LSTPADRWLDPWLALVAARAAGQPILELGCGAGRDTEVLAGAGHLVVALDLSAAQVEAARSRAPSAQLYCQDVRDPFPACAARARVVVASLSLHYFGWDETVALVERIRELLLPAGLLLCRLNSTNDVYYGAVGHPEIEKDYFLVDGRPKRFFDRVTVETLFAAGWRTLSLQEQTVQRYARPKVLWEIVAESVDDTGVRRGVCGSLKPRSVTG
jgi:SAM-dependent methyltransferase